MLDKFGIAVPPEIQLTHNSGADDPPDINALGLGWECTEFPPNQSALDTVHQEQGEMGMVVPGFSQTGSDINKIRAHAMPYTAYPKPFALDDEIKALQDVFLE